jgi:hypothetical protein
MNAHSVRIAATTALEECLIPITKAAMLAVLRSTKFSEMFMTVADPQQPVEEDRPSGSIQRLARLLALLANFGKEGSPQPIIPNISQKPWPR